MKPKTYLNNLVKLKGYLYVIKVDIVVERDRSLIEMIFVIFHRVPLFGFV